MIHPLSLEAWKEVSKDLRKAQRRVVDTLAESEGPRTCEEIAIKLGVFPNQISGRFKELHEAGFIEPANLIGRTRAGNKAIKWKINPFKIAEQSAHFERLDEANQIEIGFV